MAEFQTLESTKKSTTSIRRISQRDLLPLAAKSRNIYQKDKKNGYIEIDTNNNRIVINDGSVDRIWIGYLGE